jgi:hypothetical protein
MARLYCTFMDSAQAEKAAGALLDYGARKDDVSVICGGLATSATDLDKAAKEGISTTTPEDAALGAAKGAGVGLGVGALAGLASLIVPGFGLVIGGGALATAIAGLVGATAAGAIAGGMVGYLKDQGVPEHAVLAYVSDLQNGGALLEVVLPSGDVDEIAGQDIVSKYGGGSTGVY